MPELFCLYCKALITTRFISHTRCRFLCQPREMRPEQTGGPFWLALKRGKIKKDGYFADIIPHFSCCVNRMARISRKRKGETACTRPRPRREPVVGKNRTGRTAGLPKGGTGMEG